MAMNLTGVQAQAVTFFQPTQSIAPQKTEGGKATQKQEKPEEQHEQDTYMGAGRADQARPKSHSQKTYEVLTRNIAYQEGKTKTETETTTAKTDQTTQAKAKEAVKEEQTLGHVSTEARTALTYNYKVHMKQLREKRVKNSRNNETREETQVRKKKFFNNLKQMIMTTYQTRAKSKDTMPYSRAQYWSILSEMGEEVKAFNNKQRDARTQRKGEGVASSGRTAGTGHYYYVKMSKDFDLFENDPSLRGGPRPDPFEIVA